MVNLSFKHDTTAFICRYDSGNTIVQFTSLNCRKWHKICVFERFINDVVIVLKHENVFQVKEVSFPVPLRKF